MLVFVENNGCHVGGRDNDLVHICADFEVFAKNIIFIKNHVQHRVSQTQYLMLLINHLWHLQIIAMEVASNHRTFHDL